nr:energy-dependent translational throttle protein EttA [Actinomycetes bacterium]
MAEFIYTMRKVRKAHGDKVILDDVTLNFLPGAKIGVVGPNGAGKSSVLRIMAGLDQPNNGDAFLAPGASVGILQQEPQLDETKTVRENVEDGVAIKAKLNRYNEVAELMATDYSDELMEEMGKLQEELDAADAWDIDSQLEQAMDALRCPPPEEPVTHLSGGERRRVALCKLLLSKPDLLLLDEPTNHLDAESVLWLEQHLAEYKGAILAVTHDRYFLDNVAEWILELDRGRAYPYEGNYSTYLEKKAERVAVQGRKDAKLQKRLQEELAWVRSGAKARQAKSKARLGRYEEMAAEAEKTRKLDFEEIQIPTGPRLGNVVVEVEHLDKGFDGRQLIKDLSFTLPRNGIVGVIGPNGVGKTTLFKTIVGLEQPDSGSAKVGETVKLSYVDQGRAGIDPNKSVWEVVSGGLDYIEVGQNEVPSRAYVSAFGFKGADQQKPAGVLSGGERNRLNLALTLKEG